MPSKIIRITIVLMSLLGLVLPSAATAAAGEVSSPSDPFVSIELNPNNVHVGETTLVSVQLNNVPVEGYKSAEFTCTYNAGLLEKSNIVATILLFSSNPAL